MFISDNSRNGSTAYIEFSFCKAELKVKQRYQQKNISYFSKDSILVHVDDFDNFLSKYGSLFDGKVIGRKISDGQLDIFGLNYYDISTAKDILHELKSSISNPDDILIEWLEACLSKYYGFYILGI